MDPFAETGKEVGPSSAWVAGRLWQWPGAHRPAAAAGTPARLEGANRYAWLSPAQARFTACPAKLLLGYVCNPALVAGCAALSHAESVVEKKTEQTAIGEVIERLTHRHPTMSPLTVADVVQKMHAKFDGRPIRDFVPLFVERNARAELAKLGG